MFKDIKQEQRKQPKTNPPRQKRKKDTHKQQANNTDKQHLKWLEKTRRITTPCSKQACCFLFVVRVVRDLAFACSCVCCC